jgi:hypothetical protein
MNIIKENLVKIVRKGFQEKPWNSFNVPIANVRAIGIKITEGLKSNSKYLCYEDERNIPLTPVQEQLFQT